MNKNIFLRGTALTLALLLCLMTCFGSISVVKAVGEEAEVRMISFPRDGEANYEGWGHPEMHYMLLSWFTPIRRWRLPKPPPASPTSGRRCPYP